MTREKARGIAHGSKGAVSPEHRRSRVLNFVAASAGEQTEFSFNIRWLALAPTFVLLLPVVSHWPKNMKMRSRPNPRSAVTGSVSTQAQMMR